MCNVPSHLFRVATVGSKFFWYVFWYSFIFVCTMNSTKIPNIFVAFARYFFTSHNAIFLRLSNLSNCELVWTPFILLCFLVSFRFVHPLLGFCLELLDNNNSRYIIAPWSKKRWWKRATKNFERKTTKLRKIATLDFGFDDSPIDKSLTLFGSSSYLRYAIYIFSFVSFLFSRFVSSVHKIVNFEIFGWHQAHFIAIISLIFVLFSLIAFSFCIKVFQLDLIRWPGICLWISWNGQWTNGFGSEIHWTVSCRTRSFHFGSLQIGDGWCLIITIYYLLTVRFHFSIMPHDSSRETKQPIY